MTQMPSGKTGRSSKFISFLWGILCGLLLALGVLYVLQFKGLPLMHNQMRKDEVPTLAENSSTNVVKESLAPSMLPLREQSNHPVDTTSEPIPKADVPNINVGGSIVRKLFYFQVGAFRDEEKAMMRRELLREMTMSAYISLDQNNLFVVQAGPYTTEAECQAQRDYLQKKNIEVTLCKSNQ